MILLVRVGLGEMDIVDYNCLDWLKALPAQKRHDIHQASTWDYSILCLNVTSDVNLGNMIRTACLLGCRTFYTAGRKRWDRRGSVGANHYIDVVHIPNMYDILIDTHHPLECSCGTCKRICNDVLLQFIEDGRFTPCFIEQGGTSILDPSWKHAIQRPLFIYGNETHGIPWGTIEFIKNKVRDTRVLSIPQVGVMRSHNVTTACTLTLWEYARGQLLHRL